MAENSALKNDTPGRSGVFTTKEGLKIAYASGVDKPDDAKKSEFHVDYERVRALEVRARCHESNFVGVDILLSTDWPKGNRPFSRESGL
jgi:hypothetical protein